MKRLQMLIVFILMVVLATGATTGFAKAKKPKGTVVVALGDLEAESWLPTRLSGIGLATIPAYEYLLYRKPKTTKVIPGLAEKWECSPDGKQWTFYLRRGIQFHDGWGELTAEDVKYSFEKYAEKGSTNAYVGKLRKFVDNIKVVNPYKVIFNLKLPLVLFPLDVSAVLPYTPIISKKYLTTVGDDEAAKHPIGTGPYKFVEHKTGQYVKYEALDEHWRVVPDFKTLIIKAVPEISTKIAMLRAGEVDIIPLPLAMKKDVERLGFKLIRNRNNTLIFMMYGGMYYGPPPHKNYDPKVPWAGPDKERALKVRKAMALAVNKQAIIDRILMGEAEPLVFMGGFRKDEPWTDPSWKPYPYDPKEAKRLLVEAGYPNGFEMKVYLMPMSGRQELPIIGEAVAMDWEKIGIRCKLEPTDFASWRPFQFNRKLAWTGNAMGFGMDDEPYLMAERNFSSYATFQMGYYSKEMDDLIAKASAEPDRLKRAEYNKKIGQIFYDNYIVIGIASKSGTFAVSDKIADWGLSPRCTYPHYYEYIVRAD